MFPKLCFCSRRCKLLLLSAQLLCLFVSFVKVISQVEITSDIIGRLRSLQLAECICARKQRQFTFGLVIVFEFVTII